MSKSSSKVGVQRWMCHQLLAALPLHTVVTVESLLPRLYSFCLQERVAQPVLQAYLQPEKVAVLPEALAEAIMGCPA